MRPAEPDGGDAWVMLREATNPHRAPIIADVVGHPMGAPSVPELATTNPELEPDTIRSHLRELREAGVVEALEVPTGERERDLPYKFYRLTERARELFDANGLFPEDAWRRQYDRIAKDQEMRRLEAMPRPTTDADGGDDADEAVAP
jgi:DNA-binding transcriptional ArsR family regulator